MATPYIDTDLYQAQLDRKLEKTLEEFKPFGVSECEVYDSPPIHYRMRAEFKIWQENNQANYAMYKEGEYKKPYTIERFDPGSETINAVMEPLMQAINADESLRKKLFQIEFLTSTTKECLVTLIYHKQLDDNWEKLAASLADKLNIQIIGRSRKQKRVLSTDFITETLNVAGTKYNYQQVEASFTQPNAKICEKMLNWAVENTQHLSGDLIELYCGNGNFTLPLSKNFDKVLATEISKTSVHSAQHNIKENNINNIEIARMSSEEFTQALNGEREFKRLAHAPLDNYDFSTVFVDPPRAGLDEGTEALIQRFDNIIYISCNPTTLIKNLNALTQTHDIIKLALFDQFPYTDHRECGVILKKR